MTYLQDMAYETVYTAPPAPELTLQPEDRLDIQVLSDNPQLAAPFNAVLNTSPTSSATPDTQYTIDHDGCIDFPVLGRLHVAGETVESVKDTLTQRITRSGYIKAPTVRVKLDNFSVTVIGNVGNKNLVVDGNSINLFQVLAQAGGITNRSKIKDVMVVRTENGQRTAYTVNLQSRSVYDSPAFYLRQNDMVYVKPKGSTLTTEGQLAISLIGTGFTITSLIINLLNLTRSR